MPLLKTPKSGSASELKELEEQSTKLSSNLDRSNEKVRVDESALLSCLRQLIPLQNSYLGGIIGALQTQLKEQAKKHTDELAEIDSDDTDVVPVPTPAFDHADVQHQHLSKLMSKSNDLFTNNSLN